MALNINLDATNLKVGDYRKLSKVNGVEEFLSWLENTGAVNPTELNNATLAELMQALGALKERLEVAVSLPKAINEP